jgi:LDH2 family malate/lactate/ureidoglycolate dehydrogenase
VALDASGRPTTDPAAALAGMLLPSGGHKGYALSVFWEVLTGALADAIAPTSNEDEHHAAQFVLAIDPRASVGAERFAESVDALIDRIHESPPADGVERVYAPGERGYLTAAERRTSGIPLRASRIAELAALGQRMDVAW